MKNIYFLNISLIIVFCFFFVSSVSTKEQKEKDFYNNLPKINYLYSHIKVPQIENKLVKTPYSILYNGDLKAKIEIGRELYSENEDGYFQPDYNNKKHLNIIVDTTQIISKITPIYSKMHHAIAYPVFIYNGTKKNQIIGFGSVLYMILEAKNSKEEWFPIEKQYHYTCGTGIFRDVLKPNKICITAIHNYSGSYKTKLRLRHLGNYSNEFEGYINPTEFGKYEAHEGDWLNVVK